MVYVKDGKKYKTLKEIANEYGVPVKLVKGRHHRGLKTIAELVQRKYYNFEK